jgi:hypothetical protein
MAHIVSNTKPPSGEYGDEWFNPIENVTYKLLPASGTNGSWHAFGNVGTTILSTTDNVTNVYLTSTTTFTNTTTTTTVLSGTPGDIYWNWNSLLIDAPQSNAIVNTDASTNNFLVRFFGGVKPTNFTPYTANLNTYGSAYFNGTSDIVRVVPNAAFALGTGDYNLEFWVYSIDAWSGTTCFYNNNSNGYFLEYTVGSGIKTGTAGVGSTGTYAVTLLPVTWYHVAISRQSGVGTKCFINGTQIGTTSNDTTNYVQNGAFIGALYDGSQRLTSGYMADFRLIKGTALYTSNFAVPTAPLTAVANTSLLTLQYNGSFDTRNAAIIDEGPYRAQLVKPIGSNVTVGTFSPLTPNNLATAYIANVNGGSAYFDGSGDYIQDVSNGSNAAYTLTGDFTAEAWIYPRSLSGTYTVFCLGSEGVNRLVAQITNGQLTTNKYGNSVISYVGANVSGNVWNHIAVSRTANTVYGFINGLVSSTVTSTVYGTVGNGGFRLGADSGAANVFYGYISGFRLAKQALYTTSFTPNTIAAATTSPLLTTTLTGNNSVQFNGSNYLTIAQYTPFVFGSGDFTIEAWVYPTTTSATRGVVTNWNGGGAFIFNITSSNFLKFTYTYAASGIATRDCIGTTASVSQNQWNHVAVSRVGNTLRLFVNGVADTTTFDMTSFSTIYFYNGANKDLVIGTEGDGAGKLTGYISNLRIVKGTGLYSANFTPSVYPLTITSQGSTASQVSLLTCQSATIIDNSPNAFSITPTGSPTVNTLNPSFIMSTTSGGLTATNVNLLLNFTSGGIIDYTGQGNFETANVGLNANITPKFRRAIGPFQKSGDSMIMVPHDSKYDFLNDTNPFTIDYWIYPTDFAGLNVNAYVIQKSALSGIKYPIWASRLTTTGQVIFQVGDSTGALTESTLTGNIALTLSAWNHVAHTRNIANVLTTWVNGNVALMTFQSITMASDGARPLIIGNQSGGSGTGFDGYLENIRVTKGVCRYTAPFIPAAANINAGNATIVTSFSYSTNSSVTTVTTGAPILASAYSPSTGNAGNGEIIYTTSGNWTAPAYVSNISMVGVGGGQGGGYAVLGGGGGGGLAWVNSYPVVAGRTYTIVVGAGGAGAPPAASTSGLAGGNTYFQSNINGVLSNVIVAYGGSNTFGGSYFANASFGASGGGRGGNSFVSPSAIQAAGGGGAGGYTGSGGNGGFGTPGGYPSTPGPGAPGTGGGGGGGGGSNESPNLTSGAGGGGVGVWGKGSNGAGGPAAHPNAQATALGFSAPGTTGGGAGGSGGGWGNIAVSGPGWTSGTGGLYGGGGGSRVTNWGSEIASPGAQGAVRIIWGTIPRLFPQTYTSNNLSDAGQPGISVTSVNYLIVAGGGAGGGGNGGGGGGAGGLLSGTISVTSGSPYTITVGAGGASQTANGTPSTALTLTALGGGGGSGETGPGPSPITSPGGSGGGGGSASGTSHTGGQGITSPVRQGYPGGNGYTNGSSIRNGGGGGGAGGAGTIGDPGAQGGPGGTGLPSSITGTDIFYAGGGGGGCYSGPLFGVGGTGGGGNGGFGPAPPQPGSAGLTNRGGGGGGGGNSYPGGGALGGSGVVIISYPTAFNLADYTGSNVLVTTAGGQRIHSFYASGTITF